MPNQYGGGSMPYLSQIPGMEEREYGPYQQRGERAGGVIEGEFGPMASDPSGYLQKLLENYRPSAAYRRRQEAMTRSAGNTAAAGGMRGSLADITREAGITDRLMGDDMQQWLQNVLGIQRTGLGGEQGLYGAGFQATGRKVGDESNVLGSESQLGFQREREQYQREEDEKRRRTQQWGAAGGLLGSGLSFLGTL